MSDNEEPIFDNDEYSTNRKMTWVEKYNPTNIDEMILEEAQKNLFKEIIQSKNMSNMTFAGTPGKGKTTLANLLVKELDAISLFVPCGIKGNIDTVRTTITEFCQSKTIGNQLKIIILDEFDSASGAVSASNKEDDGKSTNNTMKAMRSIISEHQDDCRFIVTCNYVNKIIGPILSRCPPINISFTTKDILLRIKQILDKEQIKYDKESLKSFFEKIIKRNYPDIRKIISVLQICCSTGTLIVSENIEDSVDTEMDIFVKQINEMFNKKTNPIEIRQTIIQNKAKFNEEYSKLASILFKQNLINIEPEKAKNIIEYIYRMDHVVDPEIQFYGMILEYVC